MKLLQTVETAPGYRVVLYVDNVGAYHIEAQQHISTTNGSLPWEFNREGYRACTGKITLSYTDAVRSVNDLADRQREYAHGRS